MVRTIFLRLSLSLLPVTLFGFGLALSTMLVLGNPNLVKGAVKDSGLYEVLVDDLFLQNQSVLGTAIPTGDVGIHDAVESAFSPQLLQATGDNIIDGTYAWLKGQTEKPEFNVDLTGAKMQAAENVAAYVAGKSAALPVCSAAQTRQIYATGLNVYALTCRPANLTVQNIHDMVRGSLLTSNDFFDNASMTASTLKDQNGQPLYERLSFIPTLYQWTVISVYVLGGVALLASAGVVLLSRPKRAGVKRLGTTMLLSGIASAVLALVIGFASSYVSEAIAKMSGSTEALQVKITGILTLLLADIRHWWSVIAVTQIVIAVGLLLWWKFTKKPPIATEPPKIPPKL